MKKLIVLLIALLLVAPGIVHAANEIHVVVPKETDNDPLFSSTPDADEESTKVTKKFPVYVTQTEPVEVKSVSVELYNVASGIESIDFEAVEPYTKTKDGKKGTFEVPANATGATATKVHVGYIVVVVNNAAADCSFRVNPKVNGVKTGATANYIAMALGVVLLGGIYVATRSKKKMYNI